MGLFFEALAQGRTVCALAADGPKESPRSHSKKAAGRAQWASPASQ
jgi:hypothetical protein